VLGLVALGGLLQLPCASAQPTLPSAPVMPLSEQPAWYKITDRTLEMLRAEGVPAAVLSKLDALKGKGFPNESEFLQALRGILSKEELDAPLYKVPPEEKPKPPSVQERIMGHAYDPLPGFPQTPYELRSLLKPAPATPSYTCAALPEPYFVRDPLLEQPDFAPPGWFANVELDIAVPHLVGIETNIGASANTLPDVVALPFAGLDWTVAPRLQFGYRLPSAFGEIAFSYRFLTSQGNAATLGFDGPADLHSRLNLNVIDLDYLSHELSLAPHWDMKWHVGLRYANVYFDSRADESLDLAAAGSGVFEQRFSNSMWGLGPHAGVELQRDFEGTGLSLVGRLDGATLLGRIRQGFFEQFTILDVNGQFIGAESRLSGSQDVPILNFEAGVAYRPPEMPQTQVFLGYDYEEWWNVGKVSNQGTAAHLGVQGVLLRMTINY
jgi:hypothetical protein